MQVKKRTLYIVCPILIVIFIVSYIGYYKYEKRKAEERDRIELKKDLDKIVEREYKSLLREYKDIVETIENYDYSSKFRGKYLYKLNNLLESPNRYTKNGSYIYDLTDFQDELNKNEIEDKEILKNIAKRNAYKKFFWGED